MASSSTNKAPLLIDRPLLVVTGLRETTSPVTGVEPGTGSTGVLLVDCTANDGAMIDSIWLIQRVDDDATAVNLYLSTSASSLGVTASGGSAGAQFLGRFGFGATQKVGATVEMKLPRLLAPVPHAGSNIDNEPPQFRGLCIQRGLALWAAAASPAAVPAAPNIGCQGGFY